jgi:predicted small lipoprotein YifL
MQTMETTSRRSLPGMAGALLLSMLLGLGGASCGQRGPLYLPEAEPATAPAPQAQNAPDAPPASPAPPEEEDEETP